MTARARFARAVWIVPVAVILAGALLVARRHVGGSIPDGDRVRKASATYDGALEDADAASGDLLSRVPPRGTIALDLYADRGPANQTVVSLGVPFAQGVLTDAHALALEDSRGRAVAASVTPLATWPKDGSVRSVLVAFRATLAAGDRQTWKLAYGGAPGAASAGLSPNPEGPVAAVLPASWYAASRVSGILLPVAANHRFARYDETLAVGFAAIDLAAWRVNCPTTSDHRTYYDGPHAQYQRFLRSGDPAHFRSARAEARWYRDNEVRWYDDRKTAVHVCQPPSWRPSAGLSWDVIRRMAVQGNVDDYLLTGDPAAKEVVLAFGEAYVRSLPALTKGKRPSIERTERNLGWTIMGVAGYYALDARAEVRDALVSLVDRAIDWQARGTSGAFEHDVHAVDPDECANGPNGASPFMASLLVDGLMDYWLLTGATRKLEPILRRLATWYESKALTSDGRAFRYLWSCRDRSYDASDVADLNLLIAHVFGATYVVTHDTHWLDFGDRIADEGIAAMFVSRPKQWNQAARSFGRYLGYRALVRSP